MSKMKAALDLKQFMLRQKVLNLYRNYFRTIREVHDKDSMKELQDWTRREFRNNMHHRDEITIKMCIQQGERGLKELQSNIALSK